MPLSNIETQISELFGITTDGDAEWREIVARQHCPYLGRVCLKVRKSQPEISIGTCTVRYGRQHAIVIICPFRLLERKQVFTARHSRNQTVMAFPIS